MNAKKKWAHSFDVWDVIFDARELSRRQCELFREISQGVLPPEQIEKIVTDYIALSNNDPEAESRKSEIIHSIEDPINNSGRQISYDNASMPDCVKTLKTILDAGEGIVVIGTAPNPGLLGTLPQDIYARLGNCYYGPKKFVDIFKKAYETEKAQGTTVVSHVNDSLKELGVAKEAGCFYHLIHVDRRPPKGREQAEQKGFIYTDDLTKLSLPKLAKPQQPL